MTAEQSFPLPGLYGWVATAAVVVTADVLLVKLGHPSMSKTLGHYLRRPILGPALAGAWCALTYHLLIDELPQGTAGGHL